MKKTILTATLATLTLALSSCSSPHVPGPPIVSLVAKPSSLSFSGEAGHSLTKQITLTLPATALFLADDFTFKFKGESDQLSVPTSANNCLPTGSSFGFLNPGESCSFEVTFKPSAAGTASTTLAVSYDENPDSSQPSVLNIPISTTAAKASGLVVTTPALLASTPQPALGGVVKLSVQAGQTGQTFGSPVISFKTQDLFNFSIDTANSTCLAGQPIPTSSPCHILLTYQPGEMLRTATPIAMLDNFYQIHYVQDGKAEQKPVAQAYESLQRGYGLSMYSVAEINGSPVYVTDASGKKIYTLEFGYNTDTYHTYLASAGPRIYNYLSGSDGSYYLQYSDTTATNGGGGFQFGYETQPLGTHVSLAAAYDLKALRQEIFTVGNGKKVEVRNPDQNQIYLSLDPKLAVTTNYQLAAFGPFHGSSENLLVIGAANSQTVLSHTIGSSSKTLVSLPNLPVMPEKLSLAAYKDSLYALIEADKTVSLYVLDISAKTSSWQKVAITGNIPTGSNWYRLNVVPVTGTDSKTYPGFKIGYETSNDSQGSTTQLYQTAPTAAGLTAGTSTPAGGINTAGGAYDQADLVSWTHPAAPANLLGSRHA